MFRTEFAVNLADLEMLIENIKKHQAPDEFDNVRIAIDLDVPIDCNPLLTTKHLSDDGWYATALLVNMEERIKNDEGEKGSLWRKVSDQRWAR